MKNLVPLLAGGLLSLAAASSASAQYYQIPYLPAGQNPGGVNTESEGRFDLGLPGWNLLITGDANTQTTPVWSPVQTLPFSFQLNGQTFNSYKISSNGVLTFSTGATAVPLNFNRALPDASIPDNSVCMWGCLLTASNDYIINKTFGTAPYRQHWIQFNSVSIPTGSLNVPVSGGFIYCSIVLEETTNKVYFVWQRSGSNGQTLTVGIQQSATQAVQVPTSPNVSIPDLIDASPLDNAYYEFGPGTQPTLDAAMFRLRVPFSTVVGQTVNVKGAFRNQGSQVINSLTVNYKAGNGPVVSAPLSGYNAALLDSASFQHPTPLQFTQGGLIPLKVWVSRPNGGTDLQPVNDTLRTNIVVADSSMRRVVVEEDFTSSTCVPCFSGNRNTRAVNSLPANRGKFIEIKYQQNFPAPGNDPYYTVESGNRRGYYGINAIPYMMMDGGWNQNSQVYNSSVLNQFQSKPALARVTGTSTLNSTTLTIAANVKPLFATPAGRLVAHMVVTERETRNNARTNGETRFYHVMKKMLPDENGTPLPALASGQAFSLNRTFDVATLPATQAVEHLDSLLVVVFVQDVVTKEVYQGAELPLRVILANRTAQAGSSFALAPNPGTGRTTLFVNLPRPEPVRVEVLDGLGRRVLDQQLSLGSGEQQVPLDLRQQATGLYTVRLTTSAGTRTGKLALE